MNTETESTYKKFQEVCRSTSTPNNLVISSRKPIHHDNSVSPIVRCSGNNEHPQSLSKDRWRENQKRAESEIHSDSVESENSSDEYNGENDRLKSYSHESSKSYSDKNYLSSTQLAGKTAYGTVNLSEQNSGINASVVCGCLSIIALSAVVAFILSVISENTIATTNTVTIEELQDYFPLQSEDTWNALESGIDEVKNFNKPSVFLLLYEEAAEETVNRMLRNISKYAVCILNENCELQPVVLTSTILGSDKARADYGYLLDKYKPELEKKGVMVVKNLDEIPGVVAQAFHSMCDEYTPLVEKTVFFFTIRIENFRKSGKRDLQVVEEVLKNNWSDLDDDIFYPLFTRISSMVLRVVPEKI